MSTSLQQQINEFLLHPSLLLLITLLSLCFFLTRKWLNINLCNNNKSLPPSPPRLPILGNLHQLSPLTHRSLRSLGARHGPLMLLHFGSQPVIIVQSADAASEIMKTHDLTFADKPHTRTTRRFFYDTKDISIAPYGEYWRTLKSICIVHLLSGKRVQEFDFIREEETALWMKKIESCCGSPLNLSEMFVSLTNDVICRAAFGRKYGVEENGRKFLVLLREVLELMGSFSVGEFIPCLKWINYLNGFEIRVEKVAREVDEFLEMVIEEHMSSCVDNKDGGRENFVDILLDVYKDDKTNVSIDRNSIKAVILDIFAGGTDTTSATLEWAMTELLRHPQVLKELQNEVREILNDKPDITDNDLGKMRYLKAVIRETLRLHPPIPFLARVAREDVKVMGYDVAAGTMVITNAWAIGRDPNSWDGPEDFRPERFLSSLIDFKGLDFELVPFGAGRRGCPGTTFAMASVELVLANLVHKFQWELPKGMKLDDLDMMEQPGVTIHRKNPLFGVATKCYL
ncbi:cytochrome p450 71a8 [Phtheirospermum japonicum]|uniref:Cytochrome p450 71a8 n=1 Tax=Phtheirospermum japonicum TaxID=374723 RepID=A0A830BYT9_9LAMI|nr:cytochrome p450 71a8 [Phtheirospermum japonicum]